MKLCQDVLVQQVFKQIENIQDIDSFKCTWKIFDITAIMIPNYDTLSLSVTFSVLTYNVNGMSLYNKSLGNKKISTSYWPSSWLGK